MSNLVYAEVGENSPYAGSIGWIDFTGVSLRPDASIPNMEVTAKDGTVITFDLTCSLVSGGRGTFKGVQPPVFNGAAFGKRGYKTLRPIVLYNNASSMSGVNRFTFNNIQAKDSIGNAITDFSVVVADGERTNSNEKVECTTSGTGWSLLINIPYGSAPPTAPDVIGLDTATVLINGTNSADANAPVVSTNNPTSVFVDLGSSSGKQGFAIGFVVTSVTLRKDIVKRVDPADQFKMTISGARTSEVITTGNAEGLQSEVAQVYLLDGSVYTINEALANNRVGGFNDYLQTITAENLAEGGSSPGTGVLPIHNTIIWGDMIRYTIQNRPDMSDLWIEKSTAYQSKNAGESIIFVVIVGNDGPDDAVAVELVDVMDAEMTECMYLQTGDSIWRDWNGTLGIGTLSVGEKRVYYIRGRIKSGSSLTQLSNTASIRTTNYDPNLLNNDATSTLEVTHSANITITKIADHVEVTRGSWLTYTLRIENLGPSDIDDVIVTDTIPERLVQVQYSLDMGISWNLWIGSYTISQLKNGETVLIQIKGYITF